MGPLGEPCAADAVAGGRDPDRPKIARMIYDRIKARTSLQPGPAVLARAGAGCPEEDSVMRAPCDTRLRPGACFIPVNHGDKAWAGSFRPDQGDLLWCVITDLAHRITKFTDTESEFVRYREELNIYLGRR
ncbi:cell division protein YceG involved in septum cleavage [Streptosporangium lutulentum]|uniref:Cell division protein YceG involved in septum cleavage n=1 Tax=Streptosporangium lutulentum TaxID=1461250 RepID=A0ABT9QDF1_9ACTN|nr:cell division protein YceG involved in septum cleavage [Streptosporangium lutulentum]